MATLSAAQRLAVFDSAVREIEGRKGITKLELIDAVGSIDDWVNSNVTAFNSAISQPARGTLSSSQKAKLLALVVEARFKEGV